jgi:hypothetical protein
MATMPMSGQKNSPGAGQDVPPCMMEDDIVVHHKDVRSGPDIGLAEFIVMAISTNSLSRGDFVSVLLSLRHERVADSRGPLRRSVPCPWLLVPRRPGERIFGHFVKIVRPHS